mgnify:FL=1
MNIEQATLDRPPSLTDAVVAHIRDGIVRGVYTPGQALTEAQLADELGTSRGTVREALRVLSGLGLVERTAHRGSAVSRLTPKRAEEIYTLRASLESLAAQLAVERGHIDEDALVALSALVDAIETAARRDGLPGMVHADIDFHRALSAYSGHDLLMEHLDAIQVHSRRLLFYSDLYQPEPDLVVGRHRYLLEVLGSGDAYRVAIAVDEHITGPGRDIVNEMRAREHDGEASSGEDT